jgi:hypothetical protein
LSLSPQVVLLPVKTPFNIWCPWPPHHTPYPPQSVVPGTHLDQLAADDASFLEWADSGAGRAALAAELRALRARSAAGMVAQALVTPEGRDGLLSALAAALQAGDPGLAAALRSVVAAADSSSGGVGGMRLGA